MPNLVFNPIKGTYTSSRTHRVVTEYSVLIDLIDIHGQLMELTKTLYPRNLDNEKVAKEHINKKFNPARNALLIGCADVHMSSRFMGLCRDVQNRYNTLLNLAYKTSSKTKKENFGAQLASMHRGIEHELLQLNQILDKYLVAKLPESDDLWVNLIRKKNELHVNIFSAYLLDENNPKSKAYLDGFKPRFTRAHQKREAEKHEKLVGLIEKKQLDRAAKQTGDDGANDDLLRLMRDMAPVEIRDDLTKLLEELQNGKAFKGITAQRLLELEQRNVDFSNYSDNNALAIVEADNSISKTFYTFCLIVLDASKGKIVGDKSRVLTRFLSRAQSILDGIVSGRLQFLTVQTMDQSINVALPELGQNITGLLALLFAQRQDAVLINFSGSKRGAGLDSSANGALIKREPTTPRSLVETKSIISALATLYATYAKLRQDSDVRALIHSTDEVPKPLESIDSGLATQPSAGKAKGKRSSTPPVIPHLKIGNVSPPLPPNGQDNPPIEELKPSQKIIEKFKALIIKLDDNHKRLKGKYISDKVLDVSDVLILGLNSLLLQYENDADQNILKHKTLVLIDQAKSGFFKHRANTFIQFLDGLVEFIKSIFSSKEYCEEKNRKLKFFDSEHGRTLVNGERLTQSSEALYDVNEKLSELLNEEPVQTAALG